MRSLIMSLVISLLALSPAQAEIVTKTVEYKQGGKTFEAFVAYDDVVNITGKPGVLVTHDWMGITDRTKERATELAKMGYVAFANDMYGKGIRPTTTEEASKLATELKKDRKTLRLRMEAGLKEMRKQRGVDKKRVAAIGYCFGGTAALELARTGADLRSVVSFHGGLDSPAPDDGKKIKAKVLALHGADDPFVSAADLAAFEDELRKANVDYELVKYGHAVHSFTDKSAGTDNSKGAAYNPSADKRSWQAMQDFFTETL
ncbi:MAG: dienelactone hydrolase family protein [Bdellovibrionota bacterium]